MAGRRLGDSTHPYPDLCNATVPSCCEGQCASCRTGFSQPLARFAVPCRLWRCLVRRLLVASTCLGAAVAACYLAAQQPIIHLFTSDAAVAAQLLSPVWHAMCLLVLLFAPTLTLTGLIFAAQLFAYMRCLQLLGFALVFCPALWAAAALTPGSLAALWAAKLAFYAWQLAAEAAGVASTC